VTVLHGARAFVVGIAIFMAGPVFAQAPAHGAAIEYPSVAAARTALQAKPGVKQSSNDGWLILEDTDNSLWSFTPADHYANPSVGRRTLRQNQGQFFVETQILCQAQKPQCDRLRDDYARLDQRMTDALRGKK
jgi:hypothetical protein